MTNWGFALLATFVALGVAKRATWRKAGRFTVIVTAAVMVAVFTSYGALR